MQINDIVGDCNSFVRDLLQRVRSVGIDIGNYPIDHICYRASTFEEYKEIKNKLLEISRAYVENIHHDRPITKFILKEPLLCDGYAIPLLELPAPKPESNFASGLEHFEMVVGNDFEVFKEQYKNFWGGADDSGEYNQPVYITFDNVKTVKFHQYSLDEVLRKEGKVFIKLD